MKKQKLIMKNFYEFIAIPVTKTRRIELKTEKEYIVQVYIKNLDTYKTIIYLI